VAPRQQAGPACLGAAGDVGALAHRPRGRVVPVELVGSAGSGASKWRSPFRFDLAASSRFEGSLRSHGENEG